MWIQVSGNHYREPAADDIRFVTVVNIRQTEIKAVHPERHASGDDNERDPKIRGQDICDQFLVTVFDGWH